MKINAMQKDAHKNIRLALCSPTMALEKYLIIPRSRGPL
jgi:hypothetical protein